MWIEVATGTFDGRRDARSPCATSFNGAARCRIVGGGIGGFILGRRLRLPQIEADIGGQFLEQRTCVARLCLMTFLRLL
ncbi:hypothetical protein D3C72_2042170 [compost metagenome]